MKTTKKENNRIKKLLRKTTKISEIFSYVKCNNSKVNLIDFVKIEDLVKLEDHLEVQEYFINRVKERFLSEVTFDLNNYILKMLDEIYK